MGTNEGRLSPSRFFDLSNPTVSSLLEGFSYAWEVVAKIPSMLQGMLACAPAEEHSPLEGVWVGTENIFISATARVEPGAFIQGPAYIGPGVTISHGAYVRANCILLEGSMLGHASEMKNSILLPGAKAPHFAYIGDSVVGSRVNLGAGTKLSNVPVVRGGSGRGLAISIEIDGEIYNTELVKLGAIIGDDVQTGCNSVTSPGALIGMRTLIYPNVTVAKGLHPGDSVIKLRQTIELVPRSD
jgi:UDP-N-acetylglucosamine diphosphorylase / glucose-1-phosphate thymidylyltransferase / UDP-N-acetylgalactosamine diphosphorylase / glucosamine-1-phosphate N-acetyltransferase / galactosamine-1-phosphate N-acetyltransferase